MHCMQSVPADLSFLMKVGQELKEYLVVDGYNIINAWDELKRESSFSLEDARVKLLDTMADYQAYKGIIVVVVFDAHYVKNSMEKQEMYNGVRVVYTKEFESADNYIERFIAEIAEDNMVRVATSDWTEQLMVLGLGATRISARELRLELEEMKKAMDAKFINKHKNNKNFLESSLDPNVLEMFEKWRRENFNSSADKLKNNKLD